MSWRARRHGLTNRHGAANLRTVPVVRRVLVAASALLATLAPTLPLAPTRAAAATVGISDGRAALFDAPQLRELDIRHVRLVLPWDAARRTGTWTTWLARATEQGWPILLAPTGHGPAPSTTEYEAALRELLARYPTIDAVAGWNEPNHSIQPTAGKPALAAAYYEAARRACEGRCTAVAGNLLDAPSMGSYLAAYRAALTSRPAVWGIHNYYDTTYFQRSGVDQVLAITDGPIWITETGGLVSFQPNGPGTGLLPDERRAADGLRWLFTIAASEPRIERLYLYGMWQEPWNAFDSALLRVDSSEREGMQVVRQAVGPRPARPGANDTPTGPSTSRAPLIAETGTSIPGARPVLRLIGKRITVDRSTRRATIQIRCLLAACTGRITVRAGSFRYARDLRMDPGTTRTLRVRLSRDGLGATHRRPRRASARLCDTTCSTVPLAVR